MAWKRGEWMRRRARLSLVVCVTLASLAAVSVAVSARVPSPAASAGALPAASGEIQIAPVAPVQGDTLVVLVPAPGSSHVAVRFDGTSLPAYPRSGGVYRALVGTDPDVAVGAHTIAASIREAGGAVHTVSRVIRLGSGRFGVRHLTLPPKTFGLITPRNLAIESRALGPVLGRRTPAAWWRGTFEAPSNGPIDSPYGEQGVYNGHREWWHAGVDFAAAEGSPVAAANAGVVALAKALPLGGNTMVIDHGQGVLTEYLHLSAFAVRTGEHVDRGALIGRIGATGLVTGPGLHWGLYVNGLPVNPMFWLAPYRGLTL